MLVLDLPHLLHVQVDNGYLGNGGEYVMQVLGEIFGVTEKDDDSFLLIDELLDREEDEGDHLAGF